MGIMPVFFAIETILESASSAAIPLLGIISPNAKRMEEKIPKRVGTSQQFTYIERGLLEYSHSCLSTNFALLVLPLPGGPYIMMFSGWRFSDAGRKACAREESCASRNSISTGR